MAELEDDLTGSIAGDLTGTIAGAHVALPAVAPVQGLLSPRMLSNFRNAATKAMPSVAVVLRPEDVQHHTRTVKMYQAVPALRGVRCEVQKPQRQRAGEVAEREVPAHDRVITFPWGTDVRAEDLVGVNESRFEVVGTDADRSETMFLSCYVVFDTLQREGLFPDAS